jgi:hypothetical protein
MERDVTGWHQGRPSLDGPALAVHRNARDAKF